jgi:hypothetical protein
VTDESLDGNVLLATAPTQLFSERLNRGRDQGLGLIAAHEEPQASAALGDGRAQDRLHVDPNSN